MASPRAIDQNDSFRHLAEVFWQDARDGLRALPAVERWLHLFWFAGPFILLIERTPADLWLSVLALAFVVRSVIKRDFSWLRVFWVRAVFVFWGVALLSGAVSSLPATALGEAAVWLRFPLFAMATAFWLGRDIRLLHAMLVLTGIGLVVMCGILTAEILIIGQQGGRLSWPYGDLVPGNYLAKVGLPAFTIMVALAVSVRARMASVMGIIALITMVLSLMTGERINFLIRACGGMLAGLVWKPRWSRYGGLVLIEVLAVVVVFQAIPEMGNRFVDSFIAELPTGQSSPYYRTMMPGVLAFLEAPLLGVGTGNMRHLCAEIVGSAALECHPHPHNFYIQMAAETGAIGLIAGVVMLGSMIATCAIHGWKNRDNVIAATAFVIPFGVFWPIASSADFFGQWNNIFMWSGVALAMASVNIIAPGKANKP